ncbi:beta-N-acetylhexosaminidase [Allocatelliglobosispora scoriae]|uniref:beta-N-acetylhexosaminidase n=1 Tax=Allocatelliglobosispora scoriae TaxID=643052 RepID=A0A841BKF2_9ACTN|nr:glycoside hydrolase family 3 protein [Allocatelliglobosispora scoriae]MBB5869577.1 beta-N-acetylhexosaminidase [Allocatelliglobosispora scoriae]
MRTLRWSVLGLLVLASACSKPAAPSEWHGGVTEQPKLEPAARAAALVATLADEDLVGQVLMPYAYGQHATNVTEGAAAANKKLVGVGTPAEMIAKYRLGGLILVGFEAGDPTAKQTSNIADPAQVTEFTSGLQAAAGGLTAKAPLLIGTDQEFGIVTRIKSGVTQLPSAMAFGAANDPAATEAAWRAAGSELLAMGINVDFAPVADVQGASGVIGSRSFGDQPKIVGEQVVAATRGLQGSGVAATLKHFPGHGNPAADSHDDLPELRQSRQELTRTDLAPFVAGIGAGAKLVMSGHLDVRAIDPGLPASFSSKILIDLLRTELGFTGVVVTDALNMAPAQRWPAGEAAVKALLAGNDLLLMPPDPAAAYDAILAGVKNGSVPRERLVQAATRVLTLKFGLAPAAEGQNVLASAANTAAALGLAQKSITLLKGSCTKPLVTGPVRVTASGGREVAQAKLVAELKAAGVSVVEQGGKVIHLVGYGDQRADLHKGAAVTVAMDTPYLLRHADSPVLLATYSSSAVSLTALARVLAGSAKPSGRSPVEVVGLPRSACA